MILEVAKALSGKYQPQTRSGGCGAARVYSTVQMRSCGVPRPSSLLRCCARLSVAILGGACTADPIAWRAAEYLEADAVRAMRVVQKEQLCGVAEVAHGGERYRAGWDARSGALTVMRSPDGGRSWEPPVVPDSRESPEPPCNRLPPALFADSGNGFLHVAYFSEVPGGSGVYYVHSMDATRLAQVGPGMFERPLALTYGRRAVRTSVASRGDTVVVAYEDPNSARGGIHLAISSTAGHLFDSRTALPGGAGAVGEPRVELSAGELSVTWREMTEAARVLRRRGSFR